VILFAVNDTRSALISALPRTTPASLFMFDDRIVWASTGFVGGETTRPTCALLLGVYRNLAVTAARRTLHARAVLVGPNVARKLNAEQAGFYSLSLDPAHKACRWLRDEILRGRRLLDLSAKLGPAETAAVAAAIEQTQDCAASLRLSERLLAHFFPGISAAPEIDPRVQRAAAWLRTHVPPRPDMRRLGAICQLSASRLTHLFTQELGVSIRTYLLWVKMCKAIELLALNQSITEVSAAIGFADSAHLNRVLRTYYSTVPSFIANRALVQMQVCAPPDDQRSR
jgi:AraC family transcriptional regulator, arabinose operon regulatory protein